MTITLQLSHYFFEIAFKLSSLGMWFCKEWEPEIWAELDNKYKDKLNGMH